VVHSETLHCRVVRRWVTRHGKTREPDEARASVEGQAGRASDDIPSGSTDELFSHQIMPYFTLREHQHGPIKGGPVEKAPKCCLRRALRVAGSTRIEPGSTLTPLLSTRLVSPRTCMPQSPQEPCPRGLLLYAMFAPATAVASPPTTSSCASAVPVRPSHASDGRSFLPTSPAPPSEWLCAPVAYCAVCDMAVASGEAAGTAHGGGHTTSVVAACADD